MVVYRFVKRRLAASAAEGKRAESLMLNSNNNLEHASDVPSLTSAGLTAGPGVSELSPREFEPIF